MKTDVLIIGGGASGLMAAYSAAKTFSGAGMDALVTILEKMPKPGRKIMITGKGRCNFTNLKDWNDFSSHINTNPNFVKHSFYAFDSRSVIDFFEDYGMKTVVERGDRAFPASYHSSEAVDTLVRAAQSYGVKIQTETEVTDIRQSETDFTVETSTGEKWQCHKLVIATGGLSYPVTGSTGDGYRWAESCGHSVKQLFPALTALVPKGYKLTDETGHIDRTTPLSETGQSLCGIQLENINLKLYIGSEPVQEEFGDVYFTDGGIEGPAGFKLSRKCVKAIINGGKTSVELDLKPGVPYEELLTRIKELWNGILNDRRSTGLKEKERCRILLGKLMPWELIPAFRSCNPDIMTLERRSRNETKVWINLSRIAKALKGWRFDIAGYVGYERAVITAGGISTDEIIPKTMESRLVKGMYFCGEVLDMDSDTGGYNLQTAFSTGHMAGANAAKSLIE